MIEWLGNYLIHSTALIVFALVATRTRPFSGASAQDLIWKAALIVGLVTASWQTFGPTGSLLHLSSQGSSEWVAPTQHPARRVPAADAEAPVVASHAATAVAVRPLAVPRQPLRTVNPSPEADLATLQWAPMALWAWLLGAMALLADLVLGFLRLRQQLSHSQSIDSPYIPDWVRLAVCQKIASPIAVGLTRVYVPQHFSDLPEPQKRAILAHEVGHLERRDPTWRLAGKIIECVFFVQPLNRLANARIAQIAELLSDSSAVRRLGGERATLAESLLHFARLAVPRSSAAHTCSARGRARMFSSLKPQRLRERTSEGSFSRAIWMVNREDELVSPMIRSRPALVARVQRLLEEPDMMKAKSRSITAAVAMIAVIGAAGLPGVSARPANDGGASDGVSSIHITEHNGRSRMSMHHSVDGLDLSIRSRGKITFSDDDRGIASIAEGGFFEIQVDHHGDERKIRIDADGDVRRRYWVDGDLTPWENGAEDWLAEMMPLVFQTTGIDAEGRVRRLLASGGVQAVVDELEVIESDLVARIYVSELSKQADLQGRQLEQVLDVIERKVSSDLETRLALSALIERQSFDIAGWEKTLRTARTIGSDLETRLVLSAAAEKMASDPVLVATYAETASSIGSDLEMRLALSALGPHLDAADEESLVALVDATRDIGSDLEQRLALAELAHLTSHPAVAAAYVDAAQEIGSDLEARLALSHFLDGAPDVRSVARMVKLAGDSIGSDLELRLLLTATHDQFGHEPEVHDAILEASQSMGGIERDLILTRLTR